MNMKNNYKFAVIIIVMTTIFYGCSPNDYLEKYEFNIGKNQLIKKVEDFKVSNKNYVPPNFITSDSFDTLTLRFNTYIYYPKENSIVYFFIDDNQDTPDKSTINLVSINEGSHEGKYKIINKDFPILIP